MKTSGAGGDGEPLVRLHFVLRHALAERVHDSECHSTKLAISHLYHQ